MANKSTSFRIGKVLGYLRGKVWYLFYHNHGQRLRPRVGLDREAARQLAAQINAQLEVGAPTALSFEPLSLPELRRRSLELHEPVLRSSVQTIARYRTATDHLLRFLEGRSVQHASHFQSSHAAEFVPHLRLLHVSPNGHVNTVKRPLMDKGVYMVKREFLSAVVRLSTALPATHSLTISLVKAIFFEIHSPRRGELVACCDNTREDHLLKDGSERHGFAS